ncbi:hypothetical protein [Cryptosporangium phraense]|uniref:LUD domain-containing protein n=1 Tax=Cryptosporangium phraense TaxID=2593070 RepID=A0A545ATZ5_9ACTN|nr:hypothetical protein [Cryptosporangium phraense]TQS44817.1 hypothetical protein FL583_12745 [Cryptosporangium phraense]
MQFLRRELSGYASLWHLERLLRSGDPRVELARFAAQLERDASAAVETAYELLSGRTGGFLAAPSSGITKRLLARVGAAEIASSAAVSPDGRTGLSGADAVGPGEILNIVGTRELAERLPTVIVTTPDRLVPPDVFATLGSPLFERIPLDRFEAVVVGGEVLTPQEAGRRAAALAARL